MTTFNVANATQFNAAIKNAVGGDTISMAAGNYGNLMIAGRSFASPVTIVSASSTSLAHMDRLAIDGVTNLVVRRVDIGSAPISGEIARYVAQVSNSRNITLDTVHIHGKIDGDPTSDRSGLSVRWSDTVKVINSNFDDLLRGAWAQRSKNVQFVGNSFKNIRMDGLAASAVTNILIDGNKFTNFRRLSVDHSDAIQFWSTGETTASTDIIIRNNQIMQGSGTAMQGIFMRDETGTLPYQRVLIENNLVYESGYSNGITMMGGKSITIRGNTAISKTGDTSATKIRLENIAGGTISKNVTDMFYKVGSLTNMIYTENISLFDSPSYNNLLEDIALGSTATADDLTMSGYGYQFPTTTTSTTSTTSTSTTTQTSASVEKIAVDSTVAADTTVQEPAPTTATTVPLAETYQSFTLDGLYTGTFSSSGWSDTSTQSAPLTTTAANTSLAGNAFRSSYQLYHA